MAHVPLDEKRREISELDTILVKVLLKRLSLCQDIAYIKKDLNLPILNLAREDQILKKVMDQCKKDPHLKDYVVDILQQVMNSSKKLQEKVTQDQLESSLW